MKSNDEPIQPEELTRSSSALFAHESEADKKHWDDGEPREEDHDNWEDDE